MKSNQQSEQQATDALAEVIRGLARDRSTLIGEMANTNKDWRLFKQFCQDKQNEIAAIDRRIDFLLTRNLMDQLRDA